jgi:uncharacterized BrkB/YihY/UPF0761 family membrane protein
MKAMPYWQRTLVQTAVMLLFFAALQYFMNDGLVNWTAVAIGALIFAVIMGASNYYNRNKK